MAEEPEPLPTEKPTAEVPESGRGELDSAYLAWQRQKRYRAIDRESAQLSGQEPQPRPAPERPQGPPPLTEEEQAQAEAELAAMREAFTKATGMNPSDAPQSFEAFVLHYMGIASAPELSGEASQAAPAEGASPESPPGSFVVAIGDAAPVVAAALAPQGEASAVEEEKPAPDEEPGDMDRWSRRVAATIPPEKQAA